MLFGTVVGDHLARARHRGDVARCAALSPPRWMGRHSLALSLLHQPALYGALLVIGLAVGGPPPDDDPAGRQRRADCKATDAASRRCAAACACTLARFAREARAGGHQLRQQHVDEIGAACRKSGG